MRVLYELTGSQALQGILADLPRNVLEPIARVNRDTAIAIRLKAQQNAPFKTGDLRNNIAAQATSRNGVSWAVGILDVSLPSRGGNNSAHLNPWVYGRFLEFGFITRRIQSHPFMRPAVDSETQHYPERLDRAVADIERAIGKVAA